MGGFHPSFEALLKRLACDYESSRPGRSQRPRHHFLIKHLYDISVTLWMGNARMLLGLPAGEHAEGPTVARAMARSRSASSSARRRAAQPVEPAHPPSTTPADRVTATAAHNAEDQLRREEHALCTASGHADPASTVFRPFGASYHGYNRGNGQVTEGVLVLIYNIIIGVTVQSAGTAPVNIQCRSLRV